MACPATPSSCRLARRRAIRLGEADDVGLVELVAKQVRDIGICLGARHLDRARGIDQHRERRDAEPAALRREAADCRTVAARSTQLPTGSAKITSGRSAASASHALSRSDSRQQKHPPDTSATGTCAVANQRGVHQPAALIVGDDADAASLLDEPPRRRDDERRLAGAEHPANDDERRARS